MCCLFQFLHLNVLRISILFGAQYLAQMESIISAGGIDWRELDDLPDDSQATLGSELTIGIGVSGEPTPGPSSETPENIPEVENVIGDAAWGMLHAQLKANQKFWYPFKRMAPVWGFFRLNDPAATVDTKIQQVMRCVVCHSGKTMQAGGRTTKERKGIVRYNPTHGITSMKNHVDQVHVLAFDKYKRLKLEEESSTAGPAFKKSKTRSTIPPGDISQYFSSQRSYHKADPAQVKFMEDLVLFVCKSYQPLSVVDDQWMRRLLMHQNPKLLFPSRRSLVREHLPNMVGKTMEKYVLPLLNNCDTVSISFDLWMSRVGYDTFTLVVNFITREWKPSHVTIGLFEANDTRGLSLAEQVKPILEEFELTNKVIAYVKDEGSNLTTMASSLSEVVSCEPLGLTRPYAGVCFGHVMSKACQYATDDSKVCRDFKEISLKEVQSALQKTITWTKKSGKGRIEWEAACRDTNISPRKLRTPVKTRFV